MRRLLLLFAAGAALLLGAAPAGAHAVLSGSEPADGAVLEAAPARVVLHFTERPDPAVSEIRVLDLRGNAQHRGEAEPVPGRPESLQVDLGPLGEGVYTITWRVLSTVDGHITAGSLAFGMGVDPAEVEAAVVVTPGPSPLEMAGRFGLYVGLALLMGAAWVGAFAFTSPPQDLRVPLWAGLAVSFIGLTALAEAQRAAAGGLRPLAGTSIGLALAGRGAGIAVAAVSFWVASVSGQRRSRSALIAVGSGAGVAMLFHVAAGHAGAGDLGWLKVGAQWLHFAAASVWIGGLAALIAGTIGAPDHLKGAAVRRFSAVAAVAVGVLAGTGVARAWNEVGAWNQLVTTSYGRMVVLKIVLLVALVLVGAANRYRHVPAAAADLKGLRRLSGAELSLAAVVFAATAVLTSVVPARSAAPPPPEAVLVEGRDFAGVVTVGLEMTPGLAGPNEFRLEARQADRPFEADRVTLRFSPAGPDRVEPSTLELEPVRPGEWSRRAANLSLPGVWRIVVLLQSGVDSVEIPLWAATRCESIPIAAEGQPTLHTVDLGEGRSVQGYLEHTDSGVNTAHFTFFDTDGEELELADEFTVSGFQEGRAPRTLEGRKLSPGHIVSSGELDAGTWRMEVATATADGRSISACFQETVG